MTAVEWDPNARDFLRKLPRAVSQRIFRKVDEEVRLNVERYLETLVNMEGHKIRVGDYRLFVDYDKSADRLTVRAIRHRRDAYK